MPAGVLNHLWVSVNSGAVPRCSSDCASASRTACEAFRGSGVDVGRRGAFAGGCAVRGLELRFPARDFVQMPGHGRRALEAGREVHVGDVFGDELVEVDVQVGRDRQPRDDHDHAEPALHRRPAPGAADLLHHAAAAEREREQHRGGARGVGEGDQDRFSRHGADRDHGREDRARTGCVDEAERSADEHPGEEAVAAGLRPEAGHARQRRLQTGADGGAHQREAEHDQHRDGQVSQRVAAQPDPADDVGDADDRDRERDRQTQHDPQRPAPSAGAREDSSAGSTGSTQGDRAVPAPASTAKLSRTIMISVRTVWPDRTALHAAPEARPAPALSTTWW